MSAILASETGGAHTARRAVEERRTKLPPAGLVDAVNPLQGTESTFEFSRGNTLPIAALPFGMAHWTLQSHADTPWMFQSGARRLQGLRCTHQLSPWLDDYGSVSFLPVCGRVKPAPLGRSSSYKIEEARIKPYSLQLFLLRYRAQVELVPTERGAVMRVVFDAESAEPRGVLFDVPGETTQFESKPGDNRLRFKSCGNAGGVPDNFATYYDVEFSAPYSDVELHRTGKNRVAIVRFATGKEFEARIGTSFISFEQAAINRERELGRRSIDELRAAAIQVWNQHLNRVAIDGSSDDQRTTFYSCMYRALLFPRIWHEPDANGAPVHFSAFSGKVEPGVMYADHGYWDLYRAWYPMMSILFPERLGEILQAWVNAYKEGGWLPQFPAPGYRSCMTGSLIDAVFADAAVKGVPGFDLKAAYAGMKKHATQPGNPEKGYGRTGLAYYLRKGYLPVGQVPQSVAETADAAYGDFCIAQIAAILGEADDLRNFKERSRNWRNLFDAGQKFLRGKNEDGSWLSPFDPYTWGSPYVEGSAWQHRWDVPHDIDGLIEAMGGSKSAADALEEMFKAPPRFNVGVYESEIHEMSEMASVPFGQYAHSNQPVHHLLYIFAHAGRPDRTQYWVRRVLTELYTPDSFPGDEDTGSMSAWYILSALGFYPVCPGKADYTLGSPLFARVTLRLPGEKTLIIEAPGNNAKTVHVRNVSFNGDTIQGPSLAHANLMKGGTLRFNMAE